MAQQSGNDETWLAAETPVPSAPVTIVGRVLFRVRGETSYPAAQPAQEITRRIKDLAAEQSLAVDSLHLVDSEHSTDVLAGDRRIMSVPNATPRIEGPGLTHTLDAKCRCRVPGTARIQSEVYSGVSFFEIE
jgi:hypothetical protein